MRVAEIACVFFLARASIYEIGSAILYKIIFDVQFNLTFFIEGADDV